MPTLPDLQRAIGASRDFVNGLVRRGHVTFPPARKGVARSISRHDALVLAFANELTNAGREAKEAVDDATMLADRIVAGEAVADWALFDWWNGRVTSLTEDAASMSLRDVPAVLASKAVPGLESNLPTVTYSVLHVAGVIARVDALFEEEEEAPDLASVLADDSSSNPGRVGFGPG